MTLLIVVVLALGLFGLAFATKRRYGALGLGLTAGLVLSQELTKDLAHILRVADFPVEPLSFQSAAIIVLILAPALILLLSGPKYTNQRSVVIGSVVFALYGTMLLLEPLTTSMPIADSSVGDMINQLARYHTFIICVGVIAAIVDMMQSHVKTPSLKKGKH